MGHKVLRGRCDRPRPTSTLLPAILFGVALATASGGATINVPADRATVQEAVDAASNGDVILLAPGTYQGGVFVDRKAVRIVSLFHTTGDTSYIARTVIRGVDPA